MPALSPSDRALGDLLAERRILTLPQLDEAVRLAEAWGVRLGDAILARNWILPHTYYQALADYFDLPFADLTQEPPDPALLTTQDAELYARILTVPRRQRNGRIVLATADPGPDTLLRARQRWGAAVEFAVASKFDIISTVQGSCAESLSHRAIFALAERDPDISARQVVTPGQMVIGYGLLTALFAGLAFPRLFHNGDKNYRIVYQNSTWRLFARKGVSDVYKD